jgi:hypothetical protein
MCFRWRPLWAVFTVSTRDVVSVPKFTDSVERTYGLLWLPLAVQVFGRTDGACAVRCERVARASRQCLCRHTKFERVISHRDQTHGSQAKIAEAIKARSKPLLHKVSDGLILPLTAAGPL